MSIILKAKNLWFILCLFTFQFSYGQGYYSTLQETLIGKNLPVGEYLLGGGNETTFISTVTGGDVVDVTGQSFTKAIKTEVATLPTNWWDVSIKSNSNSDKSASNGDIVLAVIWIRCTNTADATFRAEGRLELKQASNNGYTGITKDIVATQEWKQYYIPFQLNQNFSVGDLKMEIFLGYKVQTVEVGGIAILNYKNTVSLSQLPETKEVLDYPGRSADAPWRASANARIEQLRKGKLTVMVKDKNGAAVPSATVSVKMKKHKFLFGTAVNEGLIMGSDANAQKYREEFLKLFNYGVMENHLKWQTWDNTGSRQTTLDLLQFFKNNNIPHKGHNMVWPRGDVSPGFIQEMLQQNPVNAPLLKSVNDQHISDISAFVAPHPPIIWDVVNETFGDTYSKHLGFTVFADWYKIAKNVVPAGTKLFINEAAPEDYYYRYLDMLIEQGAPFDGIGIEGHIGVDGRGPEDFINLFDRFYNKYNKTIEISEYDYTASKNADFASPEEDALAADFTRDILTACFSHPSMESFVMWGFWNGSHWLKNATVYRSDWSLRPSGQAYKDLVFNQWWTNANGTANSSGNYEISGFLGDYEITATSGGNQSTTTAQLNKEGTTVTIVIDNANPSTGEGDGLLGNYYNGLNFSGSPTSKVDETINFDWLATSPTPGIGSDNYSVRWTGQVLPQYSDNYRFYTQSDDGVRLWVNNNLIIDNWTDHGNTENQSSEIALQGGQKYDIKLEFYEKTGDATIKLLWSAGSQVKQIIPKSQLFSNQSNTTGEGLTALYFNNVNLSGTPLSKVDENINFTWPSSPLPGIGQDNFSVRWTGDVKPHFSENYTFYTLSDDGVRLWINNNLVINNWTDHGPTENSSSEIALVANQKYNIKLEYYEKWGGSNISLLWSSASESKKVISKTHLSTAASNARIAFEEDLIAKHFSVSPNPASSFIRVKLPAISQEKGKLFLTDVLGKTVFETIPSFDKREEVIINTVNLKSGLYVLHLKVGQRGYNRKVIVTKN